MLCSLFFRNCTTIEEYKHTLSNKIKIFTFLTFIGVCALLLNIASECTTLFTFKDFTHGFLQGFGISLITVSVIITCRTQKLLQNEALLTNKFSSLQNTH